MFIFYRFFVSTSVDLIFFRVQHPTASEAPFITLDCSRLAPLTQKALEDIPLGLMVDTAAYPVLRVFASWPGPAELGRTLAPKKRARKKGAVKDDIKDTDKHPLATLNLVNFNSVSREVAQEWFLRDAEQRIMVPAKRSNEDSELLPLAKRINRELGDDHK
jgi:hypothetical protein